MQEAVASFFFSYIRSICTGFTCFHILCLNIPDFNVPPLPFVHVPGYCYTSYADNEPWYPAGTGYKVAAYRAIEKPGKQLHRRQHTTRGRSNMFTPVPALSTAHMSTPGSAPVDASQTWLRWVAGSGSKVMSRFWSSRRKFSAAVAERGVASTLTTTDSTDTILVSVESCSAPDCLVDVVMTDAFASTKNVGDEVIPGNATGNALARVEKRRKVGETVTIGEVWNTFLGVCKRGVGCLFGKTVSQANASGKLMV